MTLSCTKQARALATAMLISISFVLLVAIRMTQAQQPNSELIGTWTTKSRAVVTGPGFYDPVLDRFLEPNLTGVSYSFTSDGRYESAYYRAVANPTTPTCPTGLLQYQHGSYKLTQNVTAGTVILSLTPISPHGRQLISSHCINDGRSLMTRYNQAEAFEKFAVYVDEYQREKRLDLYQQDGEKNNPMWLKFVEPVMVPDEMFERYKGNRKRAVGGKARTWLAIKNGIQSEWKWNMLFNPDAWFWMGCGMLCVGGVMYWNSGV